MMILLIKSIIEPGTGGRQPSLRAVGEKGRQASDKEYAPGNMQQEINNKKPTTRS
jgi:hypothetical protein